MRQVIQMGISSGTRAGSNHWRREDSRGDSKTIHTRRDQKLDWNKIYGAKKLVEIFVELQYVNVSVHVWAFKIQNQIMDNRAAK